MRGKDQDSVLIEWKLTNITKSKRNENFRCGRNSEKQSAINGLTEFTNKKLSITMFRKDSSAK